MNTYFVSQYLNVIELEASALLFNGASGALDEVSTTLGDKLRTPRASFDECGVSETERDYLKKRGHITALSQEEEIEAFKKVVQTCEASRQTSAKQTGYLMFLLSYDCNLACGYCYQHQIRQRARIRNQPQVMQPAFIEELFTQHVKAIFPGVPYDQVDVVLYGGEPFLPQHRQAIARLIDLTQQTPVAKVRAITNGTQLETMLDFFGPLPGQVNHVQISLDGDQEAHDKSRIPISKVPTFQTIIKNVHHLVEKKVGVTLRINVTPESICGIHRLVEFLEEQELLAHPLVDPYIHPIHIHYDQTDDDGLL